MKKYHHYEALRQTMDGKGITIDDLMGPLGLSKAQISNCLNCAQPKDHKTPADFKRGHIYKIMDVLDEPYERIPELFPADPRTKTRGR